MNLHHYRPIPTPLLPLLLLLITLLHHPTAAAPTTDPTATPGFASLDTCIQLCFTGGGSAHGLAARVGCATKACVCAASAAVDEYMEACAHMSCAKPRRLEWWKWGAWKTVHARYCGGEEEEERGEGGGEGAGVVR